MQENIEIKIIKMEWERVFLTITIVSNSMKKLNFVLYKENKKEIISVNSIKNKNEYIIRLNISNISNREFLSNGKWQIGILYNNEFLPATIDFSLINKIDDLSRIFKYRGNNYAYTLSFEVVETKNKEMSIIFYSYFYIKNNKPEKERIFAGSKKIKNILKKAYKKFAIFAINLIYKMFLIFIKPFYKQKNRVLLMSENKLQISGNLLALDKRIKERDLDKNGLKVYYSFRNTVVKRQNFFSWVKLLYLLAIQDYIFIDDYAPIFSYLKLSKSVKFIQLWHAGVGFKSVGYSRFGKKASPHPINVGYKKLTGAIASSKEHAEALSEVFGIDEEDFIITGMPRLDNFLNEKKINKFKESFYRENPSLKNKKIILFAPTFRGQGQKDAFYDYSQLDFERLYNFCKNEYVIVFKMHPFIVDSVPILEEYEDRLIDLSSYKDINSLYYVTDILITDYSSNFYEYSLLKRPILFFSYDRLLYETTRGFHRDFKKNAPGKICDTFEELLFALENKDYEFEKTKKFLKESFKFIDNKSSDRVIDNIILREN